MFVTKLRDVIGENRKAGVSLTEAIITAGKGLGSKMTKTKHFGSDV